VTYRLDVESAASRGKAVSELTELYSGRGKLSKGSAGKDATGYWLQRIGVEYVASVGGSTCAASSVHLNRNLNGRLWSDVLFMDSFETALDF
jgi:hypothetical protein